MKYYKIDANNIVIQVQPYAQEGFKKDSTDNVVCGNIDNLDGTFSIPSKSLQQARTEAEQRIRDGFENELLNGKFLSTVANLTVDNRRSGSKADRDNLDALIFLGNYPILWKCVDGVFNIPDATTAEALKTEMINAGLANYQNKWTKEQAITDAVTVADYEAINW